MRQVLAALWRDERGNTLTEYSLMIGIVTATVILTIAHVRGGVANNFHEAANAIGAQ